MTIRLTGAELIIRILEQHGIRTIAGIPGGMNLPLYDALGKSRKIRHILARHEQGAAFIAQGIARVSRRAAVCFATSGPGATNLLTVIADAKLDSVPLVCITGQVPTSLIGTDAFQEVDTYGMSIPVTKHNFIARTAAELVEMLPDAIRIAESGRPGSVLIDVPKNVQLETIEIAEIPGSQPISAPRTSGQSAAIQQAAQLINQSQRPMLCLGGGVRAAQCGHTAQELAEKANIPVAMTLMGLATMPHDHRLTTGMFGMHAAQSTNLVLNECDLLIAAGMRFDDRATGRVSEFCPGAQIIHIDIDPGELDKIKAAHVGITGDVAQVLKELIPYVDKCERTDLMKRLEQLRQDDQQEFAPAFDMTGPFGSNESPDLTSPQELICAVAELAGYDAMISTDVGQHQMWVAQSYPFTAENEWLTSGGLGTMGFGLPAAIGAAIQAPDRMSVCFSGDGSLLMNIQELVTAVEARANVKIVVLDNCSLGLVRQQQHLFYEDRIFAADFMQPTDFCMIARGFGMNSCNLSNVDDPIATLRHAMETPGPCLIHVPIDVQESVFPIVVPGASNSQMIITSKGDKNHA